MGRNATTCFARSELPSYTSSTGIDAVGSRQEFARRFVKGIGKLIGNMKGGHREKTGGLIARIPEATELTKVGSKLSLWSLSVVTVES
ncbi:hypothetical protein B296_00021309 [Ensete ventricosum]|uniref:Uncharacterized protein n=1 Tax=Ensete ventricosum TaxID=4639 RepID=A0A426Y2W7_ENSVE|nr:hypothetical protein B296_00021309 [Ensete ventricosum]